MKKLSPKQKLRQLRIIRSRIKKRKRRAKKLFEVQKEREKTPHFKPFKVKIWDGLNERTAICTRQPNIPPADLNFDADIDATLRFLKIIRDKLGTKRSNPYARLTWVKERKNRLPTINSFHDFTKIKSISVSAALVIASCYDRAKRITKVTPPAINYDEWPDEVFQVLFEVGFFDFIGHTGSTAIDEVYRTKIDSDFKVMTALSGRNANGLDMASEEIEGLLNFLYNSGSRASNLLPDINTAISEAMINVSRHAYPEDFVVSSAYDTVEQWWMTARAEHSSQQLTIVVYDQGSTIPGTLPYRSWFKTVVQDAMRVIIPDFIHDESYRALDHEYINHSMKKGKTQTGEPGRGLGLPQMQALIDLCDAGTLTVVSRAGLYKYDKASGVTKRALDTEIEGTLVEWNIFLPSGGHDD